MYDELNYLTPEVLNNIEEEIQKQQQKYLLPIQHNKKDWLQNEFVYVDDINNIESSIDKMGEYFGYINNWKLKRNWNLKGENSISYIDINRWINNLDIIDKLNLVVSSSSNNPLTLKNSVGLNLSNYVCYGNSYQESIPTPTNPVEIQTVDGNIELRNIGKNLFKYDVDSNIETLAGITRTINSDGSITFKGTTTGNPTFYINGANSIKLGEYTFSIKTIHNFPAYIRLNNSVGGSPFYQINKGENKISFNYNTDGYFQENKYRLMVWFASKVCPIGTEVDFTIYPMLEEGSSATEYESYKELSYIVDLKDNELVKIGDVSDKLNIDEFGNITIEKRIGKVTFNGTEYFVYDTPDNNPRFSINLGNCKNTSTREEILSNYFKFNGASNDVGNCFRAWGNIYLYPETNINTLPLFQQWLKDNEVTVYYELQNPTTINLGNITIGTLKGDSYLYTNANLEPTNISCKYLSYTKDSLFNPLVPCEKLYPSETLVPTNNKGE